ncbi:hypothetical protein [Streptomyces nigrescens]
MNEEISVRTLVLLLVGAITVYIARRDPELGAALLVGVGVVTLLHVLMRR